MSGEIKILGIDPGQTHSGWVVCENMHESPLIRVIRSGEWDNEELLYSLRNTRETGAVFCETIEPMGIPVGHSTLDTMRWVGRFQEAWEATRPIHVGIRLVRRGDEKITLCGAATFRDPKTGRRRSVTDAQIRAALIERFPATGGGKVPQIGTKAQPGPLYGVRGHAWSALAVVMTGLSMAGDE